MKDKQMMHCISGMPRSGSTLLCQILNMNPDFYAGPTSPMLGMINSMIKVFSHDPAFKAVDRIQYYDAFADGVKSFIETYNKGNNPKAKVFFDKNRFWPSHLSKLDQIMTHDQTKVIWTYRNPADIIMSIENAHAKTQLIEFADDANGNSMQTAATRMMALADARGVLGGPKAALNSALEQGYDKDEDGNERIIFVDYKNLCMDTQTEMDKIHDFLGLPKFEYSKNDFKDLKQTTFEYDNLYNYKYSHQIKEGEIKYSAPEWTLPEEYKSKLLEAFKDIIDKVEGQNKKNNKNLGRLKKSK